MDWAVRVASFYELALVDNRIGPVHISLYFALLVESGSCGLDLILPVRERLMSMAKISSTVTYHRCLRELSAYGYIDYRPSFASGRSRVEIIELGRFVK